MLRYYVGKSESPLIEVVLVSVVSGNTCVYISKYKVLSGQHNQCFVFINPIAMKTNYNVPQLWCSMLSSNLDYQINVTE